jgi:hypothetical protein
MEEATVHLSQNRLAQLELVAHWQGRGRGVHGSWPVALADSRWLAGGEGSGRGARAVLRGGKPNLRWKRDKGSPDGVLPWWRGPADGGRRRYAE